MSSRNYRQTYYRRIDRRRRHRNPIDDRHRNPVDDLILPALVLFGVFLFVRKSWREVAAGG